MIFLCLSILLTTSLIIFFKLFEKFKINTLQAIVVNYFVASSLGLLLSKQEVSLNVISHSNWLYLSIPLGLLFISIFYSISLTTIKVGVSAATVANKMSLIIPVIAAIYLYDEHINAVKVFGILLALSAVVLTSKKEEAQIKGNNLMIYILPFIVFVGSGLIDAIVNYAQVKHLNGNSDLFLGTSFIIAGITGIFVVLYQIIKQGVQLDKKAILGGIALGIPNYFSIYTLIKALDSGEFESSVFYPINNIAIVVVSVFAAYIFFREKLSKINLAGIGIALAAILLIALA